MSSAGQKIHCKAAVCWSPKTALTIENVIVDMPQSGEVRIKMVAASLCHSDLNKWNDIIRPENPFPIILGHEGAGVVESVGNNVTSVAPGDHVIPVFVPECGSCASCLNQNTNACDRFPEIVRGLRKDGSARVTTENGNRLTQFISTGTFCEYITVSEFSVAKIDSQAPLDKVCLIGCGVATGYGAAVNTARVTPGSSTVVFGLGAIGLSAIMGAKKMGATTIIGVDVKPEKFNAAKKLGATTCVNPSQLPEGKTIQQVITEMTNGGVDYAFECVGNTAVMEAAFECSHPKWGTAIIMGVAGASAKLSVYAFMITNGRTLKGSLIGGWKTRTSIPKLVDAHMKGELNLDDLITHTHPLDLINEAMEMLTKAECIRTIITY